MASDVIRDGMSLELLDANGNIVAEVFRSDGAHSVQIFSHQDGVSADVLQQLASVAIERLGPFEDGAPLSAALNYADLLDVSVGRPNKSLERTREE